MVKHSVTVSIGSVPLPKVGNAGSGIVLNVSSGNKGVCTVKIGRGGIYIKETRKHGRGQRLTWSELIYLHTQKGHQ